MFNHITKFIREEDGASAIEYGLIAALIAVALVVTLGTVGTQLDGTFTAISEELPAN